ncbi:hypothetical protein BC751_1858 [Cecembia calidifontis]|uniref:Uncharacterized protein n=1 Tax=Cecembia calidifontis TaxID=1187080 RepID=A0A4Q7P855_9BACT|nr:hypothetical protein BC751_1858 [Cecembia calidifontis]
MLTPFYLALSGINKYYTSTRLSKLKGYFLLSLFVLIQKVTKKIKTTESYQPARLEPARSVVIPPLIY